MLVDRQRVRMLLDKAKLTLVGEWLLVGGAFIALTVNERRTTEDIELIALSDSNDQRLLLLKLAEEIGLPVEAVNTAADYFVRKIADWREQLEVLESSAQCTIFGPSPTLLLLLKIGRMSESDLEDCLATVAAHSERLNKERVLGAIAEQLRAASGERSSRLQSLRRALECSSTKGKRCVNRRDDQSRYGRRSDHRPQNIEEVLAASAPPGLRCPWSRTSASTRGRGSARRQSQGDRDRPSLSPCTAPSRKRGTLRHLSQSHK